MKKYSGKWSFLCRGRKGYYIFKDVAYKCGGSKSFSELTPSEKEANYTAKVSSDREAVLITKALNAYEGFSTV